ncbi:MAG TPA: hypothetical protein VIW23_14325 [Candidatus Acidoferrum sp.]|jgi:hypothetical protein
MKYARWKTGITVCLFGGMLLATPIWIGAWQRVSPQPKPSPNAPSNENTLKGLDGRSADDNAKQPVDAQNQLEMRMDVQRLYAMATELKEEVDNTDGNAVLNTTVLKRAQQIEKLAKQIRDRAKR